jgi:hypothetical protein
LDGRLILMYLLRGVFLGRLVVGSWNHDAILISNSDGYGLVARNKGKVIWNIR